MGVIAEGAEGEVFIENREIPILHKPLRLLAMFGKSPEKRVGQITKSTRRRQAEDPEPLTGGRTARDRLKLAWLPLSTPNVMRIRK
jgi:hypothetical protein